MKMMNDDNVDGGSDVDDDDDGNGDDSHPKDPTGTVAGQ